MALLGQGLSNGLVSRFVCFDVNIILRRTQSRRNNGKGRENKNEPIKPPAFTRGRARTGAASNALKTHYVPSIHFNASFQVVESRL